MEAINKESALVAFERQLADLIQRIKESLRQTEQEVEILSNTWKDYEFVRFKDQFDQDVERLKPLWEALEEDNKRLKDVEEKLRQYLSHL